MDLSQLDTHSVPALLASILIVLAVNLIKELVKLVISFWKRKNELTEATVKGLQVTMADNTKALLALEKDIQALRQELSQLKRIKKDLNLAFSFIKKIAGEDWNKIKREVIDDSSPIDN